MWLIFISIFIIAYLGLKYIFDYWKRRGVPGPTPTFFVGNIGDNFLGRRSAGQIFADIYTKYEGYPFVGIFRAGTPVLLVRDPDFIKNILVKDFKSFYNNDFDIDKKTDPIFGRNPFVLKGEEWKASRTQLTPCFTSGKMKVIFPLLEVVSKRLVDFIEHHEGATSANGIEAKEVCTKFTLDNVASCAFGIEGKSFEDPNAEFRKVASAFVSPESWQGLISAMIFVMPQLSNLLAIKLVPTSVEKTLMSMVTETVRYREENNIVRSDFLHMMTQLKKSATPGTFTDVDLTAHAASFFIDGFETSSNVMSFVLHELACNPDIQSKLRDEILGVLEHHNDELTFETLKEMTYLDACIDESLRKQPPLFQLAKVCQEKYTYTTADSDSFKKMSITVEPGTSIIIPVGGLHWDPKYYPEPERYNPDRFLKGNAENIPKFAYLPFGEGPRICIGQRFGFLQVKLGLAYVIKNFEVKLNERTKLPLKYVPWYFLHAPKGGLYLNFHKIH